MEPQPAFWEKAAYKGRLSHLLLFHGGSAGTRRSAALRLARILNCLGPQDERPCEVCSACRRILSGHHPDVTVMGPQKASLGIEQVLAWQEKIYRKPYEGKFKVFLLEEADLLTVPAANALLKVIEEPPPVTVIVLSAQNQESLLPTVRSRAQSIYFPPPGLTEWAGLRGEGSKEEAAEAFRLGGGTAALAERILALGVDNVRSWLGRYRQAVAAGDFLRLFPLFPLEKEQAVVYLQVMAVRITAGLPEGRYPAASLPPIRRALDNIRRQANPRLVLEVLALELFQEGGIQGG
ncbi:DNA polymerase III, delta subunit [Acididesulfobacillus acetoxydans]|uniref:DNA polymerase III, delta prime subunit n=1 Tax=Acididesulfobacillus acetoxydans TaxID=1561005 RepID=A0A8S0XAI3_9FIRM|nr:DNA polymerase III subunit [Acididesulfobacillus acetoxydans]CAA7599866.1 DNA polymerase III, delta subunit [Acididesulfobacillus acetoxydans]CEJ07432.1 DNA polymerase III, delta prime subunit [Acididesulfobacillus acetoxydans]